MPKISKVKVGAKSPNKTVKKELPNVVRGGYTCSMCGRNYNCQKGNFPASHSTLYRGNGAYLTVCYSCIEDLFNHYLRNLGNEEQAIRRLCMKFDMYWHNDLFEMVLKGNTSTSRIRSYIMKTNLIKYVNNTYDDTLREEEEMQAALAEAEEALIAQAAEEERASIEEEAAEIITDEMIEFWGEDYTPSFYIALDKRYQRWTANLEKPLPSADEALYKQICLMESSIARDSAAGKSIEKSVSTLNGLLSSVKRSNADTEFDNLSFGVGIKMYENTRPIPEPDPEFKDVDGIVRYITVWFLGHLCKMLGIRNTYCKLYEEEIARMRVERPDLEEEDDETLFNDIFGDTIDE